MPDAEAFEAAAPLVECALNTDVSSPDNSSAERIHLLIVLAVTPAWGAIVDTNNLLMFGSLIDAVRSM